MARPMLERRLWRQALSWRPFFPFARIRVGIIRILYTGNDDFDARLRVSVIPGHGFQ